jgi:hypothetical protein
MTAEERRARLGRVYALLLRLAAEYRAQAVDTTADTPPAAQVAQHG